MPDGRGIALLVYYESSIFRFEMLINLFDVSTLKRQTVQRRLSRVETECELNSVDICLVTYLTILSPMNTFLKEVGAVE